MEDKDLAYIAGLIDAKGFITTQNVNGAIRPVVQIASPNPLLIDWVCAITEVSPVIINRESQSSRWTVSGSKAVIVLSAVRPWLIFKKTQADVALLAGENIPFRSATVNKMKALGWPIPKTLSQSHYI